MVLKQTTVDARWKRVLNRLKSGSTVWYLESSFSEKAKAKSAGFWWNPVLRVWWTNDVHKATRLINCADSSCAGLREAAEHREQSIAQSRAADADVDLPHPDGLEYLPYQKAGIQYLFSRPNTLLADEMGLGKTIQAIGLINVDESVKSVLVICPASLKRNWANEMHKWLVREYSIGIAEGTNVPNTDIVIANYDIIADKGRTRGKKKYPPRPAYDRAWDLVIYDEMHYCKNHRAQRTQSSLAIPAKRRVGLTGTPIVNRPKDLWTLISALDPATWNARSFWRYMKTYCNAQRNRWGWDFSGAKNLPELQERLRASIMIRRLKSEVLKELPPKIRQIVSIDPSTGAMNLAVANEQRTQSESAARIEDLKARAELAKTDSDEAYKQVVAELQAASQVAFAELSTVRHETALAKTPAVIDHIKQTLESESKIVVFAHHRDVLRAITAEFGDSCVSLMGGDSQDSRNAAIERFQNDESCTLFVGSITAAGVGITLTAASHVIFAELDWVPGNMTQAEDRCHRIGQRDSVFVQHLVLSGSLDAKMAHTLVEKQRVIESAMDKEFLPPVTPGDQSASHATPRSKLHSIGEKLSEDDRNDILKALNAIAGMCDGARRVDGMGFNKIDSRIGKDLAMRQFLSPAQAALGFKIAWKYHRQIDSAALIRIKNKLKEESDG